jgi:hypothetical protein
MEISNILVNTKVYMNQMYYYFGLEFLNSIQIQNKIRFFTNYLFLIIKTLDKLVNKTTFKLIFMKNIIWHFLY